MILLASFVVVVVIFHLFMVNVLWMISPASGFNVISLVLFFCFFFFSLSCVSAFLFLVCCL